MDEQIVLAAAVRTPIGKFGGSLASLTAVDLGAAAAAATLARARLSGDRVDQAVMGHARQAGCGPNPARQVALRAGLPVERPAYTINQACLSGMQAILEASRAIRCGEAEVVLAGGMESMSRVPYMLEGRWGFRMGDRPLVDGMYRDGFTDPICGKVMGETAETLARRYGISRRDQDAYAAGSQQRCEEAQRAGRFDAEIAPIDVTERRGKRTVKTDEHPRPGVQAEALARLAPVFDKEGSVTAGNSSGITDGASAMLVMTADAARRLDVEPLARLVDYHVTGVEPEIMGIGPVPAVRALLQRSELSLADLDLIELNEAFAAQVLAVVGELDLPVDRMNVNGGAIALGHPIGCSGNRIVVTLLHEMARRRARRALATLCVSGGLGGAMLLEGVTA